MSIPNEEIMKMMSKLALEQATTALAAQARDFARHLPPEVTGEQALMAFAAAIETNNARVWPKPKGAS